MGCDIHVFVERKVGDKWVMLHEARSARERNYKRFAALAGVRGFGRKPNGIPNDVSDSVSLQIKLWGSDGHSHGFLPIDEACDVWLATEYEANDFKSKYAASAYFDVETERLKEAEHRVVFFFDN